MVSCRQNRNKSNGERDEPEGHKQEHTKVQVKGHNKGHNKEDVSIKQSVRSDKIIS